MNIITEGELKMMFVQKGRDMVASDKQTFDAAITNVLTEMGLLPK